jgi:hypothetical protein
MVKKFASKETEVPTKRSCGTMDVHRRLLTESKSYARERDQIENMALAYKMGLRAVSRTGIVQIPVVVHVVWKEAEQNISDAQVQSQIDVLNKDFRKLNLDISQVPSVWSNLTADLGIEFFLATKDADGNPTSGITRTQTSVASFDTDDKVKSRATGGEDPWPSDRYLNMWVCKLGSGLLGYAQFPGGPAETDGLVITHTGFGTTGTALPPFDKGRTVTHEIGHWLNLYHIWGDDGTGCSGSDEVDDTPNQGGPNYKSPVFPHTSCNNAPNGDMFMNYMDYVDDKCMFMFTQGQATRVNACLEGTRSSFFNAAESTEMEKAPSKGKMPRRKMEGKPSM